MAKSDKQSDERIESAKRKYKVAEHATDSFLQRLINSPYSLGIIVVAGLCVVGLYMWLV